MIKFKRMIHMFLFECSILVILLSMHAKAVDQRIGCPYSGANLNDVHQSNEKLRNSNCGKSSTEKDLKNDINRKSYQLSSESDENSSGIEFEIDVADLIHPTSTQHHKHDYYSIGSTENLSEFLRTPRLMIDSSASKIADRMQIEPTNTLEHSKSTMIETPRDRGQNADIQDIITGIVKLLNGNVNVQTNAQNVYPTTRRYASRINNRGPPRIGDLPVFPNHEIQKTTSFPMRRPSIPYPFDLPDNNNPNRSPHLPANGVPMKDINSYLVQNNKPGQQQQQPQPQFNAQLQQNRPPWHGSRTRPPINANTNRMQLQTRPTMNAPPSAVKPTQDFRPPAILTTTRQPEKNKIADSFSNKTTFDGQQEMMIKKMQQTLQFESSSNIRESVLNEPPQKIEHPEISNKVIPPPKKEIFNPPMKPTTKPTQIHIEPPSTEIVPSKANADITTKISSVTSNALKPLPKSEYQHESATTPQLPQMTTPKMIMSTSFDLIRTNGTAENSLHIVHSTIAPTKVTKPTQAIESTEFPTFYSRRPGIVFDDTLDYKGAAKHSLHTPTISSSFHSIHPNDVLHSSSTLSNIYAEIFDVTLSAIQGPGHSKVVDLIEIPTHNEREILQTKLYGTEANDIIVSPSEDNSFVSIDGKRTYINLFGDAVESEHVRKPVTGTNAAAHEHGIIQQSAKPTISIVDNNQKTSSAPNKGKPTHFANKVIGNYTGGNQAPLSMRYNYRTKAQQNAVRIDTCIVGDDSTCDTAQNEMCKTDVGVSSCHCRPGYSRRKYRDPCRKVLSLLISIRVDRYYDKRIVWDKVFADNTSEQYEHLSYETVLAIDSIISMTPFSDDFISARVNRIYPVNRGNANLGSAGVFVNLTVQLDGSTAIRNYVQSDLQKQLIAVVHRRNNNIGNSALFVDSPIGSVSSLEDLDECSSPELNDCHSSANCSNSWGTFQCKCAPGLRDPWSDQFQRAGRECISCSNSYCNNRGACQYDDAGTQLVCECINNYYGAQCEIDGDILAVSIGASVIAVFIISLTLICLIMWGRRWNQEQKEMVGSPIFNYINRANLENHMKTMQSKTYQAALEDRMRWAQIADVMSQSNHYAVEPVAPQRVGPAPMYMYQNMPHPNQSTLPASLSMAGTLPIRSIPVSRMGMETTSKMSRRHETTSSSEEDDLVDLLGSNYQNQTGIYYDVDCESSDQQHGGTSTLQSTLDTGCSGPYGFPQRMPMSTYAPNHMYRN